MRTGGGGYEDMESKKREGFILCDGEWCVGIDAVGLNLFCVSGGGRWVVLLSLIVFSIGRWELQLRFGLESLRKHGLWWSVVNIFKHSLGLQCSIPGCANARNGDELCECSTNAGADSAFIRVAHMEWRAYGEARAWNFTALCGIDGRRRCRDANKCVVVCMRC